MNNTQSDVRKNKIVSYLKTVKEATTNQIVVKTGFSQGSVWALTRELLAEKRVVGRLLTKKENPKRTEYAFFVEKES